MNKISYFFFLLLCVFSISCKAQTVVSIYDGPISTPPNSYLKDTYNDMNPFVGTWKQTFSKGNSLTIELKKITKAKRPSGNSYSDLIVGEYKYEVNFENIVNNLPLVLNSSNGYTNHSIYGRVIGNSSIAGAPNCSECATNARYISVRLKDPSRPGIIGNMIMVHFVQNGVSKIRLRILNTTDENYASGNSTTSQVLTIPEGIYTLIKQ